MKKQPFHAILLLFAGLFFSICWACSQSKSIVSKTYGFYSERQPGNIPVDPSGNPLPGFGVDTILTVYVTSSGKELQWDTAWSGYKVYTIMAARLTETVIEAGSEKEDNQLTIIKAGKGLVIWRLDLVPLDPMPGWHGDYLKGIRIKGEKAGKPFEVKIGKLVQLRVPPSV
ncbi:MAG TPA: hypothetical protein PLU11_08895 [Chitinophagaceae bacterium]|nr:hypothetical protein [Chitinophagaceae bacterium]HPN59277.1 hypothetical protein [Chitinophagaceae bacterium]